MNNFKRWYPIRNMNTNTNSTNIIKYKTPHLTDGITITVLLAFTEVWAKIPKNDPEVHHLFLTPNLVHQILMKKKLKDNTAPTRNLKPRHGNNSPLTNQTAAALLNKSIT